jgi:hypothetical protein
MSNASQQVAELLNRSADLMEQAAHRVRQYAERAARGDVNPDEGSGYHFLVAQSLREYLSAGSNLPLDRAFQAAADADADHA